MPKQINHHGFNITVLDNGKWYINAKVMDKPKRGGTRKGAGAPKKEPTKVITFRVKLWQESAVRDAVKQVTQQKPSSSPSPGKL
jgi:hypothetical protein